MTYRDTRDAAFARAESLQRQLAEARREIIRLRAMQAAHAAEHGCDPEEQDPMAARDGGAPVPPSHDRNAVRHGLLAGFALIAISVVSAAGLRASRARYYEAAAYNEMLALHAHHGVLLRPGHFANLHAHTFYEPASFRGHVASVSNTQLAAPGAECSVVVTPVSDLESNCRVQVQCGGNTLYGLPGAGLAQCLVREGSPVGAYDAAPSSAEGDPEMELDTYQGHVLVRDGEGSSAYAINITLDPTDATAAPAPTTDPAPAPAAKPAPAPVVTPASTRGYPMGAGSFQSTPMRQQP